MLLGDNQFVSKCEHFMYLTTIWTPAQQYNNPTIRFSYKESQQKISAKNDSFKTFRVAREI